MYHIRLLIVSNHAVRMYSRTHSNRNRGLHTSNKSNTNQIAKDLHLYQTIFNPFNLFKLRIMKLSLSKKIKGALHPAFILGPGQRGAVGI